MNCECDMNFLWKSLEIIGDSLGGIYYVAIFWGVLLPSISYIYRKL